MAGFRFVGLGLTASALIFGGFLFSQQSDLQAEPQQASVREDGGGEKNKEKRAVFAVDDLLEVELDPKVKFDAELKLDPEQFVGNSSSVVISLKQSKVESTVLGVHVSKASPALRKHLRLTPEIGLLVDHVETNSGAASAGLQRFDVLQKFDDQLLVNREQLTALVRMHKPGDKVALTLFRDGQSRQVEVVLKRGKVAGTSTDSQIYIFDAKNHITHSRFQNCKECHSPMTVGPRVLGTEKNQ